jgi:hypothetical protein
VTDSVLASVRPQFRALASTLLPETRELDGSAWEKAESVMEAMLESRTPEARRQVSRFIRLANVLPVLRYGTTFIRLSESRQAAFLGALEKAPILAVRRGVWGLRTLVCMGYHGRSCDTGPVSAEHEPPSHWEPGRRRRRPAPRGWERFDA